MKIGQVLYAGSWGEVTPETINKGLGGRETAMIKLAEAWARRGHEVTNFVNVEKGTRIKEGQGFHEYIPITLTKPLLSNMPWDAVVSWEMPSVFEDPQIRQNIRTSVCEMQVAHLPRKEMEAAGQYCDYVAGLSEWHGEFLVHSGLEMKNGKVITLPNGVDLSRYPEDQFLEKVQNYRWKQDPLFIYSSSPDRGLWHLLKAWPQIRNRFSEARLEICYGLDKYIEEMKWAHIRQAQMSVEIEELVRQPGVTNLGKIGQDELAQRQMNADAWLYPLDALWPTETGCITAVENAAAGNPLIFTDADCLPSEFGHIAHRVLDMPFHAGELAASVYHLLSDEDGWKRKALAGREFAKTRTWEGIGDKWLDLFAQTDHS